MQARFITTLLATAAVAATLGFATAASAQTCVLVVEGTGVVGATARGGAEPAAGHVGSANGGVWRTTENGASASPSDVTTAPAEGRTDYLLELGGVEGDSGAPAQTEQTIDAGQQTAAALIVPAVQPPRRDGSFAAHPNQEAGTGTGTLTLTNGSQAVVPELPICGHCGADAPQADGVVVLDQTLPQGSAGGTGTGTLTLSGASPPAAAPNDPEMPVCGHCGSDVQAEAQAEPQREPERPRRSFSISIAGVTLSSDGGVAIAVGDVNGDGRGSSSESSDSARAAPNRRRGR